MHQSLAAKSSVQSEQRAESRCGTKTSGGRASFVTAFALHIQHTAQSAHCTLCTFNKLHTQHIQQTAHSAQHIAFALQTALSTAKCTVHCLWMHCVLCTVYYQMHCAHCTVPCLQLDALCSAEYLLICNAVYVGLCYIAPVQFNCMFYMKSSTEGHNSATCQTPFQCVGYLMQASLHCRKPFPLESRLFP